MRKLILSVMASLVITTISYGQTTWMVDKSHTTIRFAAVHMLVTEVEGVFNTFEGSVVSSSDDFAGANIEFSADVSSIDTGNDRRDNHLKSDDFFNAEAFPKITFKGTLQKEGNEYYLVGDFKMRDVTKPIKFKTRYNGSIEGSRGRKAGFKITGSVNRFDYGVKYNSTLDTGGLVVSDEIEITCNVELNEKLEN